METVLAVRAYRDAIRERVFTVLAAAGLHVDHPYSIPAGCDDDDAVVRVQASPHSILLVPFHGHRDKTGTRVTGVDFLRKLAAANPEFRWRVLMPVSSFAAGAITFMKQSSDPRHVIPPLVEAATLFLHEEQLDEPGLPAQIRDHARGSDNSMPAH